MTREYRFPGYEDATNILRANSSLLGQFFSRLMFEYRIPALNTIELFRLFYKAKTRCGAACPFMSCSQRPTGGILACGAYR